MSQATMTDLGRNYIDPSTNEFLLMELDPSTGGWSPAMPTMEAWQYGDVRIYRPSDRPDTLVTMPGHLYWPRLRPAEESNIKVLLGRPWIQCSHACDSLTDSQIDVIDAIDAITDQGSQGSQGIQGIPSNSFPKHLVTPVLEHAEATKKICPITMEPIQKATATVTSCGHIFQTAALARWMQTKTTCPECRHRL